MTSPFPSLVRFYILSTYGLRGATKRKGVQGEALPPVDPKTRAKAVAKAIGLAFLVLLVVADLGALFFAQNWAMYRALKPAGLQGLVILNSATSASFLVFMFGFATALSTYCLSTAEGLLLSLPVRPRHLLGAKIITVYLSECLIAFLLMATALGVYAFGERPSAAFYFYGVLSVLALPLLPIAVSYLILVPLMSVARFLRNKNAVMTLGAIVGLVFAMAFNFTVQSAASHMTDPAWILANYAGPGAFLAQAGHVYPPALLAWKATGSAGLGGLGYLVANLGSGLLALLCCAFLLGPAYAASLSRFGEMQLKRLKKGTAGSFIGKTILRRPIGLSLLQRELKLMNREPIYFINGPLIVLLLPVILGVALVAQGNQLSGMIEALRKLGDGPWLMLIAAAFGAFLGSSTSITCTAISRDAKAFAYLKALPIPMRSYALAKFLHGFVFALFGALVGSLGLGLLIGLTPALALGALFIGLSLSSLVGIAGLWLDTVNPRLAWDNPIAAMKQNPNSLIVILGAMAVLGLLGALAPILDFGVTGFLVAYGLLPALLVVAALLAYPRFAERRLARLEI